MKDKTSIPTDDEIHSFEVFLKSLEGKAPPSKAWLHERRQTPKGIWSSPKNEIDLAFRKFEAAYKGPALKKLLQNGLPVHWEYDLTACQNAVEVLLDDLYRHGTWPAPAYAKRIGVLLRRAKRRDLSDRFNVVWLKFSI